MTDWNNILYILIEVSGQFYPWCPDTQDPRPWWVKSITKLKKKFRLRPTLENGFNRPKGYFTHKNYSLNLKTRLQ